MGKILKDLFDQDVFDKILKLADSSMNYPDKADKIKKIMKRCGLKEFDSGTNRVVYKHKDYPRVVFKIGFDGQGILDNLNEYHIASLSEKFASCHELDEEGLILVEERCPTINYDKFQEKDTKKKVRRMLEELDEEGFVLLDLGLDKHKNYGVDRKGNIRIIDFGYIALKSIANFNCPHYHYTNNGNKKKSCKGHLEYNKNFTMLECSECGNIFKIDVVLEGYTESKYKSEEKLPKYKPSKDLDDFYKSYNKHRDRDTLKKFVSISNKSTTIKEGETDLNKNKFLSRMKRISGTDGASNEQKVSVPDTDCEDEAPNKPEAAPPRVKRPISVVHSSQKGIDVLKLNSDLDRGP